MQEFLKKSSLKAKQHNLFFKKEMINMEEFEFQEALDYWYNEACSNLTDDEIGELFDNDRYE